MSDKIHITLSLISHTNIGKTTLARTLLKRDIGEVRDASHVTDQSQVFTLLETETESLDLWDTPGFGNVHALLKRLRQEGGAWGWLMHEVIDRAFNRSLFSSLEAAKNVRAEADIALYLVNVRENPWDAGYVDQELSLLQALDKPVVMILNQIETERFQGDDLAELERAWREQFKRFDCLKDVMPLDAFTRSWRQELKLIDRIAPHLEPAKRQALNRLRAHFLRLQEAVFQDCADMAAQTLWRAARQRLDAEDGQDAKTLFRAMVKDLQTWLDRYMDLLTQRQGLESEGQARFQADVGAVAGLAAKKMEEKKTGLLAGAFASAGSGLMADLLAGGLTFGGGALLGFLGGYLGGFSYARLLNLRKRSGAVAWNQDALAQLFRLLLAYYLLAAFHGRGKGRLSLEEPAVFLNSVIERVTEPRDNRVRALADTASASEEEKPDREFAAAFRDLFRECAADAMDALSLAAG